MQSIKYALESLGMYCISVAKAVNELHSRLLPAMKLVPTTETR